MLVVMSNMGPLPLIIVVPVVVVLILLMVLFILFVRVRMRILFGIRMLFVLLFSVWNGFLFVFLFSCDLSFSFVIFVCSVQVVLGFTVSAAVCAF